MDLYVVKVRRFYNGREATSVISAPAERDIAELALAELNDRYQDPGNYYIERWEKSE